MNDRFEVPAQRRERLLAVLRSRGAINVSSLAVEFAVSEPTLRRDVNLLASRGMLQRVHGGAIPIRARSGEPTVESTPRRAGDRFRIALVVPSLTYYFPAIIRGAMAAADQHGVELVLRGSEYDAEVDRRHVGALVAGGQVDGIVVAPEIRDPTSRDLLTWLDGLPLPVVLVERQPLPGMFLQQVEWVASDHLRGTESAVQHLFDQGHRRIGLLANDSNVTGAVVRAGWLSALERLGLDPADQLSAPSNKLAGPDRASAHQQVREAIEEGLLTAAIVQPDPFGVALAQQLIDHGFDIPGDLALVAYDDEVAGLVRPALTAVSPPKEEVGRTAVETVVARLENGGSAPLRQILLRPRLTVRDTSLGRPHRHGG